LAAFLTECKINFTLFLPSVSFLTEWIFKEL